jgi:hypothetical protein
MPCNNRALKKSRKDRRSLNITKNAFLNGELRVHQGLFVAQTGIGFEFWCLCVSVAKV